MSFQDDCEYDPVVVDTEAARIVVSGPDGEVIQVIDVPARKMRRSEVSPEWLALYDAELKERV